MEWNDARQKINEIYHVLDEAWCANNITQAPHNKIYELLSDLENILRAGASNGREA